MSAVKLCNGKVRYLTEGHALAAATRYLKKPSANTSMLRAYHCNVCASWHLTSKRKEEVNG